jgi:hypothetical protein
MLPDIWFVLSSLDLSPTNFFIAQTSINPSLQEFDKIVMHSF